ncbi:hypothetical protein Q7C36_012742 [Tachysurus vachellii]|uniref:Uncharacterized protein n=1 Tax=Tachysurus vachellii TaxID=175792 RepID=A0AA88MN89_TACVA|nr:hypothetical protein Q7C36_012742 [Tachysurus vachellii]
MLHCSFKLEKSHTTEHTEVVNGSLTSQKNAFVMSGWVIPTEAAGLSISSWLIWLLRVERMDCFNLSDHWASVCCTRIQNDRFCDDIGFDSAAKEPISV